MNCHIWTKSKFYGMSIGVELIGDGKGDRERERDGRGGVEIERRDREGWRLREGRERGEIERMERLREGRLRKGIERVGD